MRDDDGRDLASRDDYLWDGSGTPDPEIRRLERLLGTLGHDPAIPLARGRSLASASSSADAAAIDLHARAASRVARRPRRLLRLGLAAAVLVAIATTLVARKVTRSEWEVVRIAGSVERVPEESGRRAPAHAGALARGEIVQTSADAEATIRMGDIGRVALGPRTRVRLERSSPVGHRMELLEGTIDAVTVAPPRLFVVETRAARAVDLGCAYTMEADSTGAGLLHVTLGLVSVELGGRTSYVPAGMISAMRPGRPAGTPYSDDASPAVREAIALLDTLSRVDASGGVHRAAALSDILGASRPKDVATLWHLLSRTEGAERARVLRRMLELTPLPDGVTAKGILRGDARMLDRWGAELGLSDSPWWRFWKFTWALGW
ncbi:MAG TPA: FecR domain-containing protein [Gemmatimonadaceae bacterium]